MKIHPSLRHLFHRTAIAASVTLMAATLLPAAYAEDSYILNGETITWDGATISPAYKAPVELDGRTVANELTIDGAENTTALIYGGNNSSGSTHNMVTISNSTLREVTGGRAASGNADYNELRVTNSSIKSDVYGGHSQSYSTKGAAYNKVYLTDTTLNKGKVSGGYTSNGAALNNEVYLTNTSGATYVYGGRSTGAGEASGNVVSITGSGEKTMESAIEFSYVFGGNSSKGSAWNNIVHLQNTVASTVYGGNTGSTAGSAKGNEVVIENCVIRANNQYSTAKIYGGFATSSSDAVVDATGNKVTIDDSIVKDFVYGGYVGSGIGNATGNTVTLKSTNGLTDLSAASVYGGGAWSANGYDKSCDLVTGNTLVLDGFQGAVKEVANFENIEITLRNWDPAACVLDTTETMNLDGVTITLKGIESIAAGAELPLEGESLALFSNFAYDEQAPMLVHEGEYRNVKYGDTRLVDLKLETDETTGGLLLVSSATVLNERLNPQLKALSEGRVAALTFTNRAGNLVAEQGLSQAALAAQGTAKVATFVALSAGHDKVDSGSHVDADGVSAMVGASVAVLSKKSLTLGGFIESGWGQYTTHNSFAAEGLASVRGTGESSYCGAGMLVRYEVGTRRLKGLSVDASLRAGRQDTDFSSFVDGGEYVGYDLNNSYMAAHVGASYSFKASSAVEMTLYSRYLWSRIADDDAEIAPERVHFDATSSNRLRFGARAAWQASAQWKPYAGFAYEWECSGTARASVGAEKVDAPSMRGGRVIGELGVIWQPREEKPLWIEGGVQGSAGKTQGFGAQVGCTIAF